MDMDEEVDQALKLELAEYFSAFVTARRRKRIERVLQNRTRHLTVVLEEVYQPHNTSAVLRSCECFGVQDAHIIESGNTGRINPDVDVGASRWLTLTRYGDPGADNARVCMSALRARGYRLVATTPHGAAGSLEDLEVECRTALVFGAEESGLTRSILEEADETATIPMYGFTESFNVSVSAALVLRELVGKIRRSAAAWSLTEEEKLDLRLQWYKNTVRGAGFLEKQFLSARGAISK